MQQQSEPFFREEQRFPLWVIIPGILGIILVLGIVSVQITDAIGQDKPIKTEDLVGIIVGLSVCSLITILMTGLKLITEVRVDGIYVRFFPMHLKFKRFGFEDMASYEARKYSPLAEYGGWGIRWGRSGKAYNVRGKSGVQLQFTTGKKLLIGSQKPDEIVAAIDAAIKQQEDK